LPLLEPSSLTKSIALKPASACSATLAWIEVVVHEQRHGSEDHRAVTVVSCPPISYFGSLW
jgi:hypothetical protein